MNRFLRILVIVLFTTAGLIIYKYNKRPVSVVEQSIDINNALNKDNIIPMAVIGSGPAGLSAALYGARSSLYTVVFQGKLPGGQLTTTSYVENWPGTKKLKGLELIEQNRAQAVEFGAVMVNDIVKSVDFSTWPYKLVTEEGHIIHALTVIIATGADPKELNVEGEKQYFGKGLTTCAVCDAPFYKNKKVIVVGGGDSAAEEALYLTAYADSITMLVRGGSLKAAPVMQKRLTASPKIKIVYNTGIAKILGNGKEVTGVELKNSETNSKTTLPIDGIFLGIGHTPNSKIFKDFIKLDENGYVVIDGHTQATSKQGVYAAGDVSDFRYRQAGVAAGDGIKAALDAIAFLQDHDFTQEFAQKLEKNYFDVNADVEPIKLHKIITDKDFDAAAKKSKIVVVKVGSPNCAPCKALKPIVEAVAGQLQDKAFFAEIDIDDNPKELVKRFELKKVPELLIFKNGKLVSRRDDKTFSKRELARIILEAAK